MRPHPGFLVIGAPRCGTTSLHEMLGGHPEIFMSPVKEPHFFCGYDFPFPENEILRITKDPAAYAALFAEAGDRISGESSSYYLSDPDAPARIRRHNPEMRLIAILREPAARAHSHYLLYDRRGRQPLTFLETVRRLADGGMESPVYDIVMLGRYGEQLARYLEVFPREQLLIVMFDDLAKRPVETLRRILAHVGADPEPAEELAGAKPRNRRQVPRSQALARLANSRFVMKVGLTFVPRPLARFVRNRLLLRDDAAKAPIDPRAAGLLRGLYADDTERLARLLGMPATGLWPRSG